MNVMPARPPHHPSPTAVEDDNLPAVRLDATALDRLRELDPDARHGVLKRVLEAFEKSLLRMIGQLDGAAGSVDRPLVRGIAHTLKSSAGSVGALDLARTCAEVEARMRDHAACDLHADTLRLRAACGAALKAVRSILQP